MWGFRSESTTREILRRCTRVVTEPHDKCPDPCQTGLVVLLNQARPSTLHGVEVSHGIQ